jgi:hypothetical protein
MKMNKITKKKRNSANNKPENEVEEYQFLQSPKSKRISLLIHPRSLLLAPPHDGVQQGESVPVPPVSFFLSD